ncbi:adenylosuccinate synthetase [Sphingomonas sp. BT-65]|uniref:adenylosuccinate synthetase n=1 Tax=Sphingomonas sp. BT-65 TaxID=2989821 RepID=UPI002236650E|nr:adenylosuccinate synthetase [Sphingomonas sp. BT-65]MCW4461274.1 adenylosuccinate synthetase [Sphingomonas sp. BT-65]
MRTRAVIGANYGDEGKGRTVDWLSAPLGAAALVVRSNGGAQAGHTVERTAGVRHIFHHLGAGALAGARTHLSRFMVSHPILFGEERERLAGLGACLQVSADPRGYVTTPWDMMVNQALELNREGKRHGSCGLGFGEAVGRCEETAFALTAGDLAAPGLRRRLEAIRDEWLPARIAALELDPAAGPLAFARGVSLLDRFEAQCRDFIGQVELRDDAALGTENGIVFEGAQGLLLDQNCAGFPFVTRSNTGLANIAAIAAEAGIEEVAPVYVTRCYLTRHGRGAMEDERPIARWFAVEDRTNIANPWQETLRFGLLDPERLAARIAADIAGVAGKVRVTPSLAVTCLDQARAELVWLERGRTKTGSKEALLRALETAGGLPVEAAFRAPSNDQFVTSP